MINRRFLVVFAGLAALFAALPANAQGPLALDARKLKLASANVVVLDAADNRPIYAKAANDVTPIASLTKLMTAMVTLDSGLSLEDRSPSTWTISITCAGRIRGCAWAPNCRAARCCAWR